AIDLDGAILHDRRHEGGAAYAVRIVGTIQVPAAQEENDGGEKQIGLAEAHASKVRRTLHPTTWVTARSQRIPEELEQGLAHAWYGRCGKQHGNEQADQRVGEIAGDHVHRLLLVLFPALHTCEVHGDLAP